MPLDPSIILGAGQGVTPLQNPMDIAGKALTYQNLAMQNTQDRQKFNDEQAMRNAYTQNTKVDENGNPSIDRQGILKSLASTSPHMVPKASMDFQTMDYNMQKQKLEKQVQDLNFGARTLLGVNDQASYDNALKTAQAAGHDVSHFPTTYDPNFVSTQIAKGMDAKDYATTQISKLAEENKSKELALAMNKQYGTPIPKKTNESTNPAVLIKNAPQHLQEPIAKEISHTTNVASVAGDLIKTHDKMIDALKNNNVAEYMALKKQYSASVRSAYKDISDVGAREASVEGMVKDTAPGLEARLTGHYGPSQQALRTWLTSTQAAPNATSAGIDLSKFKSTRIDPQLLSIKDPGQGKEPGSNFSPDVLSYAQKHGISPEQAQSVKTQRMTGKR